MPVNKIQKLQQWIEFNKPERAAAIVWLQGDRYDRGNLVASLFKKHYAKKIILSGNNILVGKTKRTDENNVTLHEMVKFLNQKRIAASNLSIDQNSLNTKDQASNVIKLAKQKKWGSLIIVGSRYHQLRAYLTFLKAIRNLKWHGKIINQTYLLAWDDQPAGRKTTALNIWQQEIKKLKIYNRDVEKIDLGIKYFKKFNNFKPQVYFRSAMINDAKRLQKWRNDPATRNNSLSTHKIKLAEHKKWLKSVLNSKNIKLFIIMNESDQAIGQIRFDLSRNSAVISIGLAKAWRGRGYGALAINCAVQYLFNSNNQINNIIAKIKPNNLVSKNAFINSGFKLTATKKNFLILKIKRTELI